MTHRSAAPWDERRPSGRLKCQPAASVSIVVWEHEKVKHQGPDTLLPPHIRPHSVICESMNSGGFFLHALGWCVTRGKVRGHRNTEEKLHHICPDVAIFSVFLSVFFSLIGCSQIDLNLSGNEELISCGFCLFGVKRWERFVARGFPGEDCCLPVLPPVSSAPKTHSSFWDVNMMHPDCRHMKDECRRDHSSDLVTSWPHDLMTLWLSSSTSVSTAVWVQTRKSDFPSFNLDVADPSASTVTITSKKLWWKDS